MSSILLKALMQLFALCLGSSVLTDASRRVLENFLRQNISPDLVEDYLKLFNSLHKKPDEIKIIADHPLRFEENRQLLNDIFERINDELNFKRKYILLLRLAEFLFFIQAELTSEDSVFLNKAARNFNLDETDVKNLIALIKGETDNISTKHLITYSKIFTSLHHTHLVAEISPEELFFLYAAEADLIVMKAVGINDISINNQPVVSGLSQIIIHGAVIRSNRFKTIYFSEVHKHFVQHETKEHYRITVDNVLYKFDDGSTGIQPFSLDVESGTLMGIMGNSGAGKSTLLGILNGSYLPASGRVLINGEDIHSNKQLLEQIGFIPQDDLLISELTVFENLYYSARLSIGKLNDDQLRVRINKTLNSLGLYDIRNIKVGDALNKYISGGQRKRLNIALELIREPKILLVDEPTSGLSSNDAENIMDLLREIADKGSIVMVVIHQPSSEIYKLFDALTLFDRGGFHIYHGHPLDAVMYFKRAAAYADSDKSECISCGNVNPEIIFTIVESKLIDEYGRLSNTRKVSPAQWYAAYRQSVQQQENDTATTKVKASSSRLTSSKSSAWFQYFTYLKRDIASKSKNAQYLFVNLLIAPLLGTILAAALRYHNPGENYSYATNNNITVILFISVIVAFFLGLSVSAEEIIKDKHVLKREALLRLSRNSYLLSKISVLFIISMFQVFTYTLIIFFVLGLNSFWYLWWILMLTSFSAVMLGLNLSAGFKTAVTVYILIPFIVIPQLLLSGIMVRFDRLNTVITADAVMPAVGNTMVSRWAFESIALNEIHSSKYSHFSKPYDIKISKAHYIIDYWYDFVKQHLNGDLHNDCIHSLQQEAQILGLRQKVDASNANEVLETVKDKYIDQFSLVSEALQKQFTKQPLMAEEKKKSFNSTLNDLLRNKESMNKVKAKDNKLIRLYEPVFDYEPQLGIFASPMYAPVKLFLGQKMNTHAANILILVLSIVLLYVCLYFNAVEKILGLVQSIKKKKQA